MFKGYSKEENEMSQYNLLPGGVETEDSNATESVTGNTANNVVKDTVVDTNGFGNGQQFEYDMDGESLW